MKKLNDLVRQFLEYCEVEKGHSVLTIENYKHYLERFEEWGSKNGIKSPADISLDKIHKYRLWLNRFANKNMKTENASRLPTIKKNTQNYHLIALRSFLKYLAKNDIKSLVPEKIELASSDDRHFTFLEPEELDRLFSAPNVETINGYRDRTIMEVLFSTGMRVSELINLNRDKINLKTKEFSILGKGGKIRVVFLSARAADWLSKYLSSRQDKDKAVFIRHGKIKNKKNDDPITKKNDDKEKGLRLTPRTIQRILNKYSKAAGILKKVTPHTMRHSFGTDLMRSGADIRAVQQLLGHSSITTTQIYTHVTDQHLREVHRAYHGRRKS